MVSLYSWFGTYLLCISEWAVCVLAGWMNAFTRLGTLTNFIKSCKKCKYNKSWKNGTNLEFHQKYQNLKYENIGKVEKNGTNLEFHQKYAITDKKVVQRKEKFTCSWHMTSQENVSFI